MNVTAQFERRTWVLCNLYTVIERIARCTRISPATKRIYPVSILVIISIVCLSERLTESLVINQIRS